MDGNVKPAGRMLSAEELSAFCLQLSYPVSAGVPTLECIGLVLEQTEEKGEREILSPVYDSLLAGASLSDALKVVGCFPPYMLQMVEVGQASGNLDKVLAGLTDYYLKEAERAAGVRRAVTGPSVMLGVMAVLIFVLIVKVLPVFNQVFMQMGVELSPLALWLLKAGQVIQGSLVAICAVLVVAAVCIFILLRRKQGVAALNGIADKIFFSGRLGLALSRARFASAMALMASGGIDLDESLERSQPLLEGTALSDAVSNCREAMRSGAAFPKAVQDSGIFTGVMRGILTAGFKAGSFDRAIAEIATRCQAQAEDMLDRFIMRIEPTLIVILSVSVGLVLLSVMLPLISMLSSIGI